jgi:cation diffusion facilitator CzcD-associated flavoprotein CzcO
VLLERADDIGGTWRDNTYPGCRCDVPSHLYSFSFAPNPNWSSTFSPQHEILDYLRDCAEQYGVTPHIRSNCELHGAEWDEDSRIWWLDTSQGELTADVVIAAQGPLSDSSYPDLPGLESFEGTTFHSARWEHDHDLEGERVAVISTGASAIQFVPAIQPKVAQMHVFQRTAPWVVPHPNRPMKAWERVVYRFFPPAQLAMRGAIYWARESFVLQFRRPGSAGSSRRWRSGTSTARWRTLPCVRSSGPTTRWAASASCPPTSGIRRLSGRTSSS